MSDNSDSDALYHHKSINIEQSSNTEYLVNYYNLTLTSKLEVDSVILESLHWKRKAIESFNTNDQILWYWISIENLFEDTSLIFDILPKLFATNKLYQFTWKHYHKLLDVERIKGFGYFKQNLELPEELCEKIGFRKQQGENIQLKDFINNIADLKEEIANDCLFYDQLDLLEQIFNDSKSCIKLLKKFELMARERLLFIYRIRNKIVHDASSKTTATSNYYVNFICQASSDILFEFIRKRGNLGLQYSEDIFNEIQYDFDKLKIEIKEKESKNLLDN